MMPNSIPRGLTAVCGACSRGFSRIDGLVIYDWAMAPLSEPPASRLLGDVRRPLPRSTMLTSQLPVSRWHEQIGDPTLTNGILDRLVHNASNRDARRFDA